MKHFFIKTVLIMVILFLCVIYGMEVAKNNMLQMVGGSSASNQSLVSQLAKPIKTPALSGQSSETDTSSAGADKEAASSVSATSDGPSQSVASQDSNSSNDMTKRKDKLEKLQDFNPYSSLGESLSNGFQATFSHGIAATANLFGDLVKHL